MTRLRHLGSLAFAATLLSAAVPRQSLPRGAGQSTSYTFLIRRGADTVSIERVTRSATRLEAALTTRALGTIRHISNLAPDGTAFRTELQVYTPGMPLNVPTPIRFTVVFRDDSSLPPIVPGDSLVSMHFDGLPNAIPYMTPSLALTELVMQRARHIGGDSVRVPLFVLPLGRSDAAIVRRVGPDSIAVLLGRSDLRLRVDSAGYILGGTVQGLTIERH